MFLIKFHSGLAYLVLGFLFIFLIAIFFKFISKKRPTKLTKAIGLVTMILTHTQVLIGIVIYFVFSPKGVDIIGESTNVMANKNVRFYIVEHPIMMLIGAILLTISYSKLKRLNGSVPLKILILVLLAAVFLFARVPYDVWL